MVDPKYADYLRVFMDCSLNTIDKTAGLAYYIRESNETYYVPTNLVSSRDAELLEINEVLTNCLLSREKDFSSWQNPSLCYKR